MSYQQAERAYMQGNYREAAELVDELMQHTPDDPRVRLLRGHIYCYGLQQYDTALDDYEAIAHLTDEPSFLDYASQGIETCREFGGQVKTRAVTGVALEEPPGNFDDDNGPDSWSPEMDLEDSGTGFGADSDVSALSFDSLNFADLDSPRSSGMADPQEAIALDLGSPQGDEENHNGSHDAFDFSFDEPDEIGFDADGFDSDEDVISLGSGEPISLGSGEAIAQGVGATGSRLANDGMGMDDGMGADFVNPFGDSSGENPFGGDEALGLVEDNPFSTGNPFGAQSPNGFAAVDEEALSDSDGGADLDDDFSNDVFGAETEDGLAEPAFEDSELNFDLDPVPAQGEEVADEFAFDSAFTSEADFFDDGSPGDRPEATLFMNDEDFDLTGTAAGFAENPLMEPGAPITAAATPYAMAADPDDEDYRSSTGEPTSPSLEEESASFFESMSFEDESPAPVLTFETPNDNNSLANDSFDNFDAFGGLEDDDNPETDFGLGGQGEFDTFAGDLPSISHLPGEMPSGDADSTGGDTGGRSNADFLEEFDAFDDFGGLSEFDLAEDSIGFTSPIPTSGFDLPTGEMSDGSDLSSFGISAEEVGTAESVWGTDNLPSFTQSEIAEVEPTVAVEQGILAPLENASLTTKRTVIAATAGLAAALGVVGSNVLYNKVANPAPEVQSSPAPLVLALAGGVAGMAGAGIMGELMRRQIRRTTEDLQAQFSKIVQGNFNAQATIYSEDELGQLAAGFNQMSRVILATTKDAQRKAEEQEQQKEDLQRQVIRLLDDVEGAARGDLTVQAEVTADVLGAVADSFNLTIQNLREIVLQVKTAATQVNKAASENETFARSLSSDALRQAEELAVTLNSVQVMTDSIQRVADSAREAEEVARTASVTALKGGEAVEKTVAGILQIRETVAETTRKVKRLAESSQEISKIVALISQIASRTNLLALNASIEAARAGDAGRGFAIVADEVRQLADRAAKSSKEIEQIVLQIQGETSSVMVAMEEGTQQVITGTKLAEQAKRSLDDIIQVSNRIDQLVRSITADTVEQTETSRQVAQVMQSVELTAQETSQEAQRVSRSLQNLVGVASDLQTSVERFRVESSEEG